MNRRADNIKKKYYNSKKLKCAPFIILIILPIILYKTRDKQKRI